MRENNSMNSSASECKECKIKITSDECAFSLKKYGLFLCRVHQDTKYREGMIKGRIAETLIEELFLSLGFNVFRYGMENAVPGIMKLLKKTRSDVADIIRKMPDFVIQNPNTADVFFIEVKFRASEEFSINDIDQDYPFENCFFIVVSKKHIKCLSYLELKSGKSITPSSHNYLGNRKEFELDKEKIISFCDLAVKYFSEV